MTRFQPSAVALAAALVAANAAPSIASAETVAPSASAKTVALASVAQERSLTLTTVLRPSETGGEYDGSLQLHISRDGIISGFYRPQDGSFVTIEGGLDGNKFWLDLGWRGRIHITGTFDGRTLDGGAFFDGQSWTFTGKSTS